MNANINPGGKPQRPQLQSSSKRIVSPPSTSRNAAAMISGGSATLQQPPPPAASTAVSSTASGMAYPYPTPTITPHHHYQPSTTYHHQYHHGAQVQYCATTPTIAPPPTHYDHDHRPPSMTTWGTFVFQPAPMPASSNSACYHVPNPLDAIAAAYPPSAASAAPPVGMTTMMQPVSHEHIVSRSSCPTAHTNYNTTAGTTKTAPSTHVPSSSYVNEVVETYDYKKRKVANNNDNMEEQKDKLAAVDAIFAAAEVIAKRPSPSPTNLLEVQHRQAAAANTNYLGTTNNAAPSSTATNNNNEMYTPSPRKPIKKRKVNQQSTPSPTFTATTTTKTPNNKKKRSKKSKSSITPEQQQQQSAQLSPEQNHHLTNRALFLSQTIESEPSLYRTILLHMALERETPRRPAGLIPQHAPASQKSPPADSVSKKVASLSAEGAMQVSIGKKRGNQFVEGVSSGSNVITDGFFWKDVPELEAILQRNMEEYYDMSENCPQSKSQQEFNNRLVNLVHSTALQCGYTFDPLSFAPSSSTKASKPAKKKPPSTKASKKDNSSNSGGDDNFNYKKLRDRIRCYYKTHVQNSKKRLITLLKNPTRPKNRELLIKIVDEVKSRAANGSGVGRNLSPNGREALRRLEELERSMMHQSVGNWATPESRGDILASCSSTGVAAVPPSETTSSSSPSGEWHAPPSPHRLPMNASQWCNHGDGVVASSGSDENNLTSEVPFSSPCKPEHVAMLQSIRQVSVQF